MEGRRQVRSGRNQDEKGMAPCSTSLKSSRFRFFFFFFKSSAVLGEEIRGEVGCEYDYTYCLRES